MLRKKMEFKLNIYFDCSAFRKTSAGVYTEKLSTLFSYLDDIEILVYPKDDLFRLLASVPLVIINHIQTMSSEDFEFASKESFAQVGGDIVFYPYDPQRKENANQAKLLAETFPNFVPFDVNLDKDAIVNLFKRKLQQCFYKKHPALQYKEGYRKPLDTRCVVKNIRDLPFKDTCHQIKLWVNVLGQDFKNNPDEWKALRELKLYSIVHHLRSFPTLGKKIQELKVIYNEPLFTQHRILWLGKTRAQENILAAIDYLTLVKNMSHYDEKILTQKLMNKVALEQRMLLSSSALITAATKLGESKCPTPTAPLPSLGGSLLVSTKVSSTVANLGLTNELATESKRPAMRQAGSK